MIENVAKFVRDMQEIRMSYMVATTKSEVFLEALKVVQEAIHNLYYHGFLVDFQGLFHWK